jgi:hypothetical protein
MVSDAGVPVLLIAKNVVPNTTGVATVTTGVGAVTVTEIVFDA